MAANGSIFEVKFMKSASIEKGNYKNSRYLNKKIINRISIYVTLTSKGRIFLALHKFFPKWRTFKQS